MALRGVREAVRHERNLRTHFVVSIGVILLAAWLNVSRLEWAVLILCMGNVVAVELLNTAVETVVDLVSPEHHFLAGKAKDIAAGAVLTLTIMSIILGLMILGPPLMERIQEVTGLVSQHSLQQTMCCVTIGESGFNLIDSGLPSPAGNFFRCTLCS